MALTIAVFVDGLKPESLEHMPFLNSLVKRRMKTTLGYSPTCYASMFSGVYPNKHLYWFTWQYAPQTSPYRWLNKSKIDRFSHNIFGKYALFRTTEFLTSTVPSWHGIMRLTWWDVPVKNWHYFDIAIKKNWFSPNFVKDYPSIFDILAEKRFPYGNLGLEETSIEQSLTMVERQTFDGSKQLYFVFIGEIDTLSHRYGQDSNIVIKQLKLLDHLLAKKLAALEKKQDVNFLLFSDHGHLTVKEKISLHSIFKDNGDNLDDYIFFNDGNYARFWFRNSNEERQVKRILTASIGDKGFILNSDLQKKYKVDMSDNRFGDLVFYVDAPYMLATRQVKIAGKTIQKKYVSNHGYLPDYPDSDAVLVSNKKMTSSRSIQLVDICPSILSLLGVDTPTNIDGASVWK